MSGGAGDDTISGLVGSTFTVGDNINGGAGSDTLNLIDSEGTAASFASVTSVETVNVRTLVASGTDVTELNAAEWVGVTTLTNASSLAASELQFSGLATTTQVVLHGNTDISGNFANTTTADISIAAVGAGSFAGVTTYGSTAVTADATAHFSLDGAAAGTISGVTISLSGNNLLHVDAGATADRYTITGNGSAVLITNDRIATADASAFTGNLDLQLDGVSDVVAKGGAGNDTVRFGTTYSNADSFDGGAGNDTIYASIQGFNRNLNATNVEAAVITFTEAAGGELDASASTVTAYTFAAGTAGNAAVVTQISNGATITLNDDDLGNVTLDYASGATTTTLNIGSVSGTVAVGTLAITDVGAVIINSVGATAGATIGTASYDSDVKAINITTSGSEADLTIGTTNEDGSLGGATSLTVTSNGSAAITFSNIDFKGGSTLSNVTIAANGTDAADVTLGDVSGSAITSIVLNAASGADIVVGTLDLGNNSTAGESQDITVSVTQGNNSDVTIGAITVTSQGTTTINVTSNGTGGDLDIAAIVLDRAGNVTADSAPLNLSFGAVSVGASATYAVDSINAENAGTGAQITFGAVTVGDNADWSAGEISATATINVDISSITLTVGSGASADLGAISTTAGAIGAVSVTLLAEASATFGAVAASAVGTYSIIAGSGAAADFGNIATFSGGNANQGRVGAIEIAGVDAADVTFGTIGASAVGAISVSGELDVTFGKITTTTIGEVNATGLSSAGAFTIDLSGVTNAIEVKLGAGANTVISGQGNDVITLLAGRTAVAGNDTIRFNTSIAGTDYVANFIAGANASGGDQIEIDVAGYSGNFKVGTGSALAAGSTITFSTGEGSGFTFDDTMILLKTAYASTAAMISDFTGDTTLGSAIAAASGSADYMVVWTDGTDTYVSQISVDAESSAGATTLTLVSASAVSVVTLVQIAGVTPGALSANVNFDVV